MIQNNLFKAKASCYEMDNFTPELIDDSILEVRKVYKSAINIKDIINTNILSVDEKISNINYLVDRIMALTQDLNND